MGSQFRCWLITMALLWLATKSFAGVADLELSIDHPPLDDLAFGQIIPFSITLTNNGPDTAGGKATTTRPISVDLAIEQNTPVLITENTTIEQSCFFLTGFGEPRPPNPLIIFYSFNFLPIPTGDSITCYGLMQVFLPSGNLSVEWFNFPFLLDTDPDNSNNNVTLQLGVRPPMVPTLSLLALGLLMLSVLFWTRSHFEHQSKKQADV